MKAIRSFACSFIAITLTAASARAGEIPIDISSLANEPWTFVGPNGFIITNGSTFPTGNQNFGGVPFTIPAGPNNYWAGGAAADFGAGTVSLTIPVGMSGVTCFHFAQHHVEPARSAVLSVCHFQLGERRDCYTTTGRRRECP
jgi:hypothetical protein